VTIGASLAAAVCVALLTAFIAAAREAVKCGEPERKFDETKFD
jgi:hypothetical protein